MSAITRIQYDVSLEILEFVENTHLQIQYTVSLGTSHLNLMAQKNLAQLFWKYFPNAFPTGKPCIYRLTEVATKYF